MQPSFFSFTFFDNPKESKTKKGFALKKYFLKMGKPFRKNC